MSKKKKQRKAMKNSETSHQETPEAGEPKGRRKKQRQAAKQFLSGPNLPLTGLAAGGMLLTFYLAMTSWLGTPPIYCSEGSSCDIVQQSRWGTFLGLPTAVWGFLLYATLGHIGHRIRKIETHWKASWTLSLIGLTYSLYLMYISFFVIEAACIYCIISFSLMAAIFVTSTIQRPRELSSLNFPSWAGQAAAAALIIVGGIHLHYSGVFDPTAGPEDPFLMGLAEHLTRENAVLYGAYW